MSFQVTVVADGPLARGGIQRNQTICDSTAIE